MFCLSSESSYVARGVNYTEKSVKKLTPGDNVIIKRIGKIIRQVFCPSSLTLSSRAFVPVNPFKYLRVRHPTGSAPDSLANIRLD